MITRTQLLLFLIQLACIVIFFDSFFNVSNSGAASTTTITRKDNVDTAVNNISMTQQQEHICDPHKSPSPPFSKLIFMVVDAMRSDLFFSDHHKSFMPFTMSKVNQSQNAFTAHAHPPTVTLPRLKSMMTGMMPHFLDVIFNLIPVGEGSSDNSMGKKDLDQNELSNQSKSKPLDDFTLLYKLKYDLNWKMVLLGDETWTRISPLAANGMYFDSELSDTTNSLFVSDTLQVDLNVTRHLPQLLNGAKSTHWDMLVLHYLGLDHIGHVYGVSEHSEPIIRDKMNEMDQVVKQLYEYATKHPETLIVLCSDHGMTNTGNHGGASSLETQAVLSFLSPKFDNTVNQPSSNQHLTVNQIDLVPTLSMLLGIDVPIRNVGKLIHQVIDLVRDVDVTLCMLETNYLQLINQITGKDLDVFRSRYSQIGESSDLEQKRSSLINLIGDLSAHLVKQKAKFDNSGIWFSILGMMSVCLVFGLKSLKFQSESNMSLISVISFIVISILCSLLLHRYPSDVLDPYKNQFTLILIGLVIGGLSYLISILLSAKRITSTESEKSRKTMFLTKIIHHFMIIILILHTLSLTSSSFIEEEHHIWYYFTSTLCFLLLVYQLEAKRSVIYPLLMFIAHRISKEWHQSGIKYQDNRETTFNNVHSLLESNSVLRIYLLGACLCILGYAMIHFRRRASLRESSTLPIIMILSSIIQVLTFKTIPNIVGLPIIPIYIFCGIHVLYCMTGIDWKSEKRSIITSQLMLFTGSISIFWILIEKVENSPLILLILLQVYCLLNIIMEVSHEFSNFDMSVMCYGMGMSAFYYFGRNISISSVDFSVAYQGLTDYNPTLIGFLVFMEIYLPKIIFCLVIPLAVRIHYKRAKKSKTSQQPLIENIFPTLLALNSFQLLTNSVMLFMMRDHLFIWSVFSPKYLWVIGDWLSLGFFLILLVILLLHSRAQSPISK